ncbi:hypothetical protein CORMATOL_00883 [Corynebacterium matruchotii ATCC 33806]|uniref:Uncharacterized protein n=1 Tax=Corynebacterium matruchotii ATCC 33806 TaxID=566549 RepID=C0E1N2_9CORY|nr:hypothetical protein CORMATOL_00883 [Corynebacterium matruchotii ATCC 33806]
MDNFENLWITFLGPDLSTGLSTEIGQLSTEILELSTPPVDAHLQQRGDWNHFCIACG